MKFNAVLIICAIVLQSFFISFATARTTLEKVKVLQTNSIEEDDKSTKNPSNIDEDLLQREQYAKKMISYMNQSVDPCDDFYEYACGNWKNTLTRRYTERRLNNILNMKIELSDMVENLIMHTDEKLELKYAEELRKARQFHKLCLEANLYPLPKSKEYLQVIDNIIGFPAVDENWQANNFDWFNATAQLSLYGVNTFVREKFAPASPLSFQIQLPAFGFDVFVNRDNIASKKSYGYIVNEQRMRQYLTTYGAVESRVTEVIDSIFELWHAILEVTDEFENNKVICSVLHDEYDTVWDKWQLYRDIVWNGTNIRCPCSYFYEKLDLICNERKAAVANYLALKFLYHMDADLEGNDNKKDFCNIKIMTSMKYLMDQLYMAQRPLKTENEETRIITQNIRTILREELTQLPWLDEDTRKEALLKESTLSLIFGRKVSEEVMEKLIKEMRQLHIEESNYEKSNLNIAKFQADNLRIPFRNLDYSKIFSRSGSFYLGMHIRAAYNHKINSIIISAGFLNAPIYHKSWPWALKYGTLGHIIGHELSHGFDTIGATVDSLGRRKTWFTLQTQATFDELTECYIDKYNKYEIPEIRRFIDGELTKNENIADHAGLRFAYKAYKNHLESLKKESDLMEYMPELNLTSQQLFYLGFTQLLCADFKEKDLWQQLDNEHPVDKYRVLGTLSNTKEFSEAYNCALGSNMNPNEKKCQIW